MIRQQASYVRTRAETDETVEIIQTDMVKAKQHDVARQHGSVMNKSIVHIAYNIICAPVLHEIIGIPDKIWENIMVSDFRPIERSSMHGEQKMLEDSK
jgi:hypothetical protein